MAARFRVKLLIAAAVVAVGAGAALYFVWWKPVILGPLRLALEVRLSGMKPRVTFGSLDLLGLNTVVVRDLAVGTLDDPNSLIVPESRVGFSLWDLLRRRFDAAGSVRSITLLSPQVTVTLPARRAKGRPPSPRPALPTIPLPDGAALAVERGRLLVREAGPRPRVITFTDLGGSLFRDRNGRWRLSTRFTSPDSPRQGTGLDAELGGMHAVVTAHLTRLDLAPLAPWIDRLELPVRPGQGRLSGSLAVSLTSSPSGRAWRLAAIDGRMDLAGISMGVDRLPFRLNDAAGTVRFSGLDAETGRLTVAAPRARWTIAGRVQGLASPVLSLKASCPAADIAELGLGVEGRGPVTVSAEGPAAAPRIGVVADLSGFRYGSLGLPRLWGEVEAVPGGQSRIVRLTASTSGGPVSVTGTARVSPPVAADLQWSFTPSGRLAPALAGDVQWKGRTGRVSARTTDGIWTLDCRVTDTMGLLQVAATGQSSPAGRMRISGTVPKSAPSRSNLAVTLSSVPSTALYLDRVHAFFTRVPARVTATGRLAGTAAGPVLTLDLGGSSLALDGRAIGVDGNLVLGTGAVELKPLSLGGHTSIFIKVPFDGTPPAVDANSTGLPLSVAFAALEAPAWTRSVEGLFAGKLAVRGRTEDLSLDGSGEVRSLVVYGRKAGSFSFAASSRGRTVKASRLMLKGPVLAIGGDGTFTSGAGEWDARGSLVLEYLKAGKTDIEGRAEITGKGDWTKAGVEVRMTAVRIDSAQYPDAEAAWSTDGRGRDTVKLSWEDLLSLVASRDSAGYLSLTGAFSELPVAPFAGALERPAPIQKLSGSLSLKGPADRLAASATVKWERGEAGLRGWASMARPGAFALTLSAQEKTVAAWAPFLRSFPALASFPGMDGSLSCRGLDIEGTGGLPKLNGWIGLRDLSVSGRRLGNGSLRMASGDDAVELEAEFESEAGSWVLNPTRVRREGDTTSVSGAFAWKDVPAGRAKCSLSRGTVEARWQRENGTATLFLCGLALDSPGPAQCPAAGAITVLADRDGGLFRLSSPAESAWRAIGTVSLKGTLVTTAPDDRAGGAWLIMAGADNAAIKLSGSWPAPGVPDHLSFEGHRLPASLVLSLLDLPPSDGLAEADLDWQAGAAPPLKGRLALTGLTLGRFPLDLVDAKGSGTPGGTFTLSSFVLKANGLNARGSGSLATVPEPRLTLNLSVEKLSLGYLSPLGFIKEGDASALGRLTASGPPGDPELNGSLVISPGNVMPATIFSELKLAEGRLNFSGRKATLRSVLNDLSGAPVEVVGEAEIAGLVPKSFRLSLTALAPVLVDGIPAIYKGTARGRVSFEGTPAAPVVRGEVTLEEGKLKTPPKRKKGEGGLADRLEWDLKVRFGGGVQYAMEPVPGAPIDLARLSSKSRIEVTGKGEDMKVSGEVLADEGPLTLFMGRELWKK